jgi:hypothetical protein
MTPPRSAFGAPPQGGAASGPAKPVPRRPLEDGFAALAGPMVLGRRQPFSRQLSLPFGPALVGGPAKRG